MSTPAKGAAGVWTEARAETKHVVARSGASNEGRRQLEGADAGVRER
jgi:hypothetical protein